MDYYFYLSMEIKFLSIKGIEEITKKEIGIFGCIKIQTISIKKSKRVKSKQQNQPEKNVNKNIKN